MLISFVHTDFRIYWPSRLIRLKEELKVQGHVLKVIEIAGKGSPYSFSEDGGSTLHTWWDCLYPDRPIETISPREASRTLYKLLDELQPDIVFAGAIAYPSGATSIRWARKRERPLVLFDDVRRKDVYRTPLVNWVKKRIYHNADGILIPAPSHRPDYETWGIHPNRIFYGLNVVDNDAWANRAKSALLNASTARSRLGLPDQYLLAVGRQIPKKNFASLIRAYEIFRKETTSSSTLDLVLVGDGPERPKLQQIVFDNKISGVHFHSFRQSDELGCYYALAGALILPSLGETWGLVVNEAMACGLPVIVSKQCGCAETLVKEGKNGWTFNPQNEKELADLLKRCGQLKQSERLAMGNTSRQIVSNWGLDRFVKGVLEAIETVKSCRRGFVSLLDHIILTLWNGRYRPT